MSGFVYMAGYMQHMYSQRNILGICSSIVVEEEQETKDETATLVPSSLSSSPSNSATTFNTTNIDTAWCLNATCHTKVPLCEPCQRRWLIIFTTGRTASTTLTWMLDALPGVRMAGENNDTLNKLWQMLNNVRYNFNFLMPHPSWKHFPVPHGAYACPVQSMMETINPAPSLQQDDSQTIVGFKTIRLIKGNEKLQHTEKLAAFLQESFPCARYVVNYRSNSTTQLKSQKKAFRGQLQQVDKVNERLRALTKLLGHEITYSMDMEEWTKNVTIINNLVSWLGFSNCEFRQIMSFNTPMGNPSFAELINETSMAQEGPNAHAFRPSFVDGSNCRYEPRV